MATAAHEREVSHSFRRGQNPQQWFGIKGSVMKKMLGTSLLTASLLISGATAATAEAKPTLGPHGYGSLKLGMSLKQAKATGTIVRKKSVKEGRCTGWDLKKFPTAKDEANVYISSKRGVAAIFAGKKVKTPQGIKIGATYKQVKAAYPRMKKWADGVWTAKVPGNKKAHYTFYFDEFNNKVVAFGILLNKQDCNLAY